jgi:hypothetical protein
MQGDTIQPDDSRRLFEGLLALAEGGVGESGAGWSAEDLASIWRHQLTAPLAFDLGELSPEAGAAAIALCKPLSIKSVSDLLGQMSPPLELLRMLKDFARSKRTDPDATFPSAIAMSLYFAAIAMALLRLDCRLSRMDDSALRSGMQWTAEQTWLDQATRELAAAAVRHLDGEQRPGLTL